MNISKFKVQRSMLISFYIPQGKYRKAQRESGIIIGEYMRHLQETTCDE